MSRLNVLYNAVAGYVSGIQDKLVASWGGVKASTEEYIGDVKKSTEKHFADVVIDNAVKRMKNGVTNLLDESETASKDAGQGVDVIGETVSRILHSLGGQRTDEAGVNNTANDPVIDIISKVGSRFATEAKEAIKKQVANVRPEDITAGLAGIMAATMTSLGSQLNEPSNSSQFSMDTAMKVVGVLLLVIGGLTLASSFNQSKPEVQEPDVSRCPVFSV